MFAAKVGAATKSKGTVRVLFHVCALTGDESEQAKGREGGKEEAFRAPHRHASSPREGHRVERRTDPAPMVEKTSFGLSKSGA